ncbi:MAG: DinB family protein [Chthonomonas sp.]|nr:DinB family protein [Chthonomonas sp.]
MDRDIAPLPDLLEPYATLGAMLLDATYDWKDELFVDDLPAEEVCWKPRPNGQSIGAIMLHMIIVEVAWLRWFVLKEEISAEIKVELMWNEINVDEDKWPSPYHEPLSWYFALQDRYRKETIACLKQLPPPDEWLPATRRKLTPRWVLGHVIQHESYHGGQIVMLHDLYQHQAGV